jgi:hypothetical protein
MFDESTGSRTPFTPVAHVLTAPPFGTLWPLVTYAQGPSKLALLNRRGRSMSTVVAETPKLAVESRVRRTTLVEGKQLEVAHQVAHEIAKELASATPTVTSKPTARPPRPDTHSAAAQPAIKAAAAAKPTPPAAGASVRPAAEASRKPVAAAAAAAAASTPREKPEKTRPVRATVKPSVPPRNPPAVSPAAATASASASAPKPAPPSAVGPTRSAVKLANPPPPPPSSNVPCHCKGARADVQPRTHAHLLVLESTQPLHHTPAARSQATAAAPLTGVRKAVQQCMKLR